MGDRSTLDIILAVQDCKPATEEELRLCIAALVQMEFCVNRYLKSLLDAIDKDRKVSIAIWSKGTKDCLASMFDARKKPPAEWLGPGWTPGTPEYHERQAVALAMLRKYEQETGIHTGILDDEQEKATTTD